MIHDAPPDTRLSTASSDPAASSEIERLLRIMAALRTPGTGCPWDLAQTFASIAPYTIEEAYEVADAIERGDLADLRDELGDLLLQVVFHARMAEEAGAFTFADIVRGIADKMVRRHPHIFGGERAASAEEVRAMWSRIKAEEKRARGDADPFADVKAGLPAIARALALQKAAAGRGLDWRNPQEVVPKVREEIEEVAAELAKGPVPGATRLAEEIGDLLFSVVNLARHSAVDPEAALRAANEKFRRRASFVVSECDARGIDLSTASLAELDRLWELAKSRGERLGTGAVPPEPGVKG